MSFQKFLLGDITQRIKELENWTQYQNYLKIIINIKHSNFLSNKIH
jgi:hypothetical protein